MAYLTAAVLLLVSVFNTTGAAVTATPNPQQEPDVKLATIDEQPDNDRRTISGAPLTVTVFDNLAMAVNFDGRNQFFAGNAAGTYISVDGTVYGHNAPASWSFDPIDLTPVSNSGVMGIGSEADPFRIETVVRVGDTGLELTQVTSYVNGELFYRVELSVRNTTGNNQSVRIIHAADLFLNFPGNQLDYGFGIFDRPSGSVGALSQDGRSIQVFTPITPADAYQEAFYDTLWNQIGTGANAGPGFNNSVDTSFHDVAAGLQWNRTIPANGSVEIALAGAFGIEESIIDIYTPPSGLLDVVFLVDQSASMAGTIEIFQREIDQVVERLRERVPNTAFGLATFADYPIPGPDYGVPGDVPYTVQQTITTDLAIFRNAVANITLMNGGDNASACARALYEVVDFNWRDNAQRVVVLIGDAEPHTTNTLLGSGLPDPGRDGIPGTSDDIDFVDAINLTRRNRITTVSLLSETQRTTPNARRSFELATDRQSAVLPRDTASITSFILRLVNAAVGAPVDPNTTAIVLDSFTATVTPGGIEVRWVTSREVNTWGFHLLRSADGTRASAERVTSQLIPAQGRGQAGATYTWLDTSADPDGVYTYWLQEIETDGTVIEYDVATLAQAPMRTNRIFLPVIIR